MAAPDPSAGAGGARGRPFRPVAWKTHRAGYELHVTELDEGYRWWVRDLVVRRSASGETPGRREAEAAALAAVERLMGEALPRVGRWTQTKAEGVYGEVWTLDGELCDVRPEPDGTWWSWRHQFSGATGSCATRDEAMTMGERVTEALKGVLR